MRPTGMITRRPPILLNPFTTLTGYRDERIKSFLMKNYTSPPYFSLKQKGLLDLDATVILGVAQFLFQIVS